MPLLCQECFWPQRARKVKPKVFRCVNASHAPPKDANEYDQLRGYPSGQHPVATSLPYNEAWNLVLAERGLACESDFEQRLVQVCDDVDQGLA